jgi:hypothetical protein
MEEETAISVPTQPLTEEFAGAFMGLYWIASKLTGVEIKV